MDYSVHINDLLFTFFLFFHVWSRICTSNTEIKIVEIDWFSDRHWFYCRCRNPHHLLDMKFLVSGVFGGHNIESLFYNILKLWVELADETFIEFGFTKRAGFQIPTTSQNALTVEEVANITGQSYRFLARLELFHANRALRVTLKHLIIEWTLVKRE